MLKNNYRKIIIDVLFLFIFYLSFTDGDISPTNSLSNGFRRVNMLTFDGNCKYHIKHSYIIGVYRVKAK